MKIAGSPYARSPRNFPLEYPGARPDHSFLFLGDSFDLLADEECRGRRLGQWWVLTDDGARERLDERLLRLGATPVDERTPVLAYGSNAAPAQLESKYAPQGQPVAIPVARATTSGLDVVFAAKVASYGSVPATVMPSADATVDVAVTFLDDEQLHALDATERSYDRCRVTDDEVTLVLASGEQLSEFDVYVSTVGVLLVDGAPWRLAAVRAEVSALRGATQAEARASIAEACVAELVPVGHPATGPRLRYGDLAPS